MKIREAENQITAFLQQLYPGNESRGISRLLIEHITGMDPKEILVKKEEELSDLNADVLEPYLKRLADHEPIQYIMKKTWFYGMELFIEPSVLIPRPETEELVDWVVSDIRMAGKDVFTKRALRPDETTQMKIMDVCTGSGCIALALKKNMPLAEVWGCDTSDKALNIARRNGSSLDIRVDFQGIDFLDPSQHKFLPSVDIMVCNPPYIPAGDQHSLNRNVIGFEPHEALFVPDHDPLVFYRALMMYAQNRLHDKGSIYMEVHEDRAQDVMELFRGYAIELRKDMQGKERMVKARAV